MKYFFYSKIVSEKIKNIGCNIQIFEMWKKKNVCNEIGIEQEEMKKNKTPSLGSNNSAR